MTLIRSGRPRRRFLLLATLVVALVAYLGNDDAAALRSAVSWLRGRSATPVQRVMDDAGVLRPRQRLLYEDQLSALLDESGVDVRFLFVRAVPGGDLRAYALERMRALGVGKDVDRRGLLFVYDLQGKRLRIEVGPQLEGVFPDGLVGYLMREHAAVFFESARPELGLRLTLYMLHSRLRQAALGLADDPAAIAFITDSVRLAAGAGASVRAGVGVASAGFLGRSPTRAERERFAAQPTVALVHERYLEWLKDGEKITDLELFTAASQRYLSGIPMTPAYNASILLGEYGQSYRVAQRGPLAMLYFTSTPLVSPHMYRHVDSGWQLDIMAEVRYTREYSGGEWSWFMMPGNDFSVAFADMLDDYGGGELRVRDGDNRPLPVHTRLPPGPGTT